MNDQIKDLIEKIIKCYKTNIGHQHEKLEDIVWLAGQALVLLDQPQWRDISIAPKDGRQILIYFKNDSSEYGDNSYMTVRSIKNKWQVGIGEYGIRFIIGEDRIYGWQPLPEPPKE